MVSGVTETARPLAAREVDFGQSLAMCPARPQNMQSLWSNRYFLSSAVSLPSLPNLDVRSGFATAAVTEGLAGLVDSFESFGVEVDAEVEAGVLSEDV